MKGRTLILIGLFTIGLTGFAQGHPGHGEHKKLSPEERAEKKTAKMTETLNLSPDQAAKIKTINLAHFEEMDRLKAEMKANRENLKTETDAVLTDEQKKILEEKKAEKKAEMKERKNHRKVEKE